MLDDLGVESSPEAGLYAPSEPPLAGAGGGLTAAVPSP